MNTRMTQPQAHILEIKEYAVSMLVRDPIMSRVSLDVDEQHRIDLMARQLTITMRVPSQVVSDNRLIASYPDGLWQHVRSALGLTHRRKEVRLNEHLLFPEIPAPEGLGVMRVYTHAGITDSVYSSKDLH